MDDNQISHYLAPFFYWAVIYGSFIISKELAKMNLGYNAYISPLNAIVLIIGRLIGVVLVTWFIGGVLQRTDSKSVSKDIFNFKIFLMLLLPMVWGVLILRAEINKKYNDEPIGRSDFLYSKDDEAQS